MVWNTLHINLTVVNIVSADGLVAGSQGIDSNGAKTYGVEYTTYQPDSCQYCVCWWTGCWEPGHWQQWSQDIWCGIHYISTWQLSILCLLMDWLLGARALTAMEPRHMVWNTLHINLTVVNIVSADGLVAGSQGIDSNGAKTYGGEYTTYQPDSCQYCVCWWTGCWEPGHWQQWSQDIWCGIHDISTWQLSILCLLMDWLLGARALTAMEPRHMVWNTLHINLTVVNIVSADGLVAGSQGIDSNGAKTYGVEYTTYQPDSCQYCVCWWTGCCEPGHWQQWSQDIWWGIHYISTWQLSILCLLMDWLLWARALTAMEPRHMVGNTLHINLTVVNIVSADGLVAVSQGIDSNGAKTYGGEYTAYQPDSCQYCVCWWTGCCEPGHWQQWSQDIWWGIHYISSWQLSILCLLMDWLLGVRALTAMEPRHMVWNTLHIILTVVNIVSADGLVAGSQGIDSNGAKTYGGEYTAYQPDSCQYCVCWWTGCCEPGHWQQWSQDIWWGIHCISTWQLSILCLLMDWLLGARALTAMEPRHMVGNTLHINLTVVNIVSADGLVAGSQGIDSNGAKTYGVEYTTYQPDSCQYCVCWWTGCWEPGHWQQWSQDIWCGIHDISTWQLWILCLLMDWLLGARALTAMEPRHMVWNTLHINLTVVNIVSADGLVACCEPGHRQP